MPIVWCQWYRLVSAYSSGVTDVWQQIVNCLYKWMYLLRIFLEWSDITRSLGRLHQWWWVTSPRRSHERTRMTGVSPCPGSCWTWPCASTCALPPWSARPCLDRNFTVSGGPRLRVVFMWLNTVKRFLPLVCPLKCTPITLTVSRTYCFLLWSHVALYTTLRLFSRPGLSLGFTDMNLRVLKSVTSDCSRKILKRYNYSYNESKVQGYPLKCHWFVSPTAYTRCLESMIQTCYSRQTLGGVTHTECWQHTPVVWCHWCILVTADSIWFDPLIQIGESIHPLSSVPDTDLWQHTPVFWCQ